MAILDLDIGADVYCKGDPCGTVHKVIINETQDRITDLIIEQNPTTETAFIVPVALAENADGDGVHLSISKEELETYPEDN